MIPTLELKKLRAFHKSPSLKKDMVAEIMNHQKLDKIIKGTYGTKFDDKEFRGCAVGCSIHSYNIRTGKSIRTNDHSAYETELGIPEYLARLEDYLFEAMPDDKAMKWPAEFMKAIPVGANLSMVAPKFISGTLKDVVKLKKVKGNKAVVKAVLDIAKLWEKVASGHTPKSATWSAAESAARSAAHPAAESAVRLAALSAAESVARLSAWSAAESAVRLAALSAESVARLSAWSAAESAVRLAAWSAAESAVRLAAWSAAESVARLAALSTESAEWSAARSGAAYKMSRRLLTIIRTI